MILRELTLNYALDFHRWVSDKAAVKYSLSAFQQDRSIDWIHEYIAKILNDNTTWNRVIEYERQAIGYCGLSGISSGNCSGEYFILIGDKSHWSKGIGTLAGEAVLRTAFLELRLHRVWLTVSSPNKAAIRSYEKLGFHREGALRDACFRDGQYHNKIVMGILDSEWPNQSVQATARAVSCCKNVPG